MRRLSIPLLLIAIAVAIGVWFAFDRPSTDTYESADIEALVSADVRRGATNPIVATSETEPLDSVRSVELTEDSALAVRDERIGQESIIKDGDARVWLYDPEIMESILLNELAQVPGLKASSDITVDCTAEVCEIRYTSIGPDTSVMGPDSKFVETIKNPPYSAYFGFKGSRIGSSEEFETTLTLRSSPRPPPTVEEVAEQMQREAEIIRGIARNYLPTDSYDAVPVVFGSREGADVVVENICSSDCPRDTERILYVDVPQGRSCDQLGGTERIVLARLRNGGFEERTFCVPNFLIEN